MFQISIWGDKPTKAPVATGLRRCCSHQQFTNNGYAGRAAVIDQQSFFPVVHSELKQVKRFGDESK